jgi:hypothetical protein
MHEGNIRFAVHRHGIPGAHVFVEIMVRNAGIV